MGRTEKIDDTYRLKEDERGKSEKLVDQDTIRIMKDMTTGHEQSFTHIDITELYHLRERNGGKIYV